MRVFDLIPNNGRKSFYGKAKVKETENRVVLQSYDTNVCMIENGKFVRLWDGFSSTTMNHVNAFRELYNLPGLNKKTWLEMETAGNKTESDLTWQESYKIMMKRRTIK